MTSFSSSASCICPAEMTNPLATKKRKSLVIMPIFHVIVMHGVNEATARVSRQMVAGLSTSSVWQRSTLAVTNSAARQICRGFCAKILSVVIPSLLLGLLLYFYKTLSRSIFSILWYITLIGTDRRCKGSYVSCLFSFW